MATPEDITKLGGAITSLFAPNLPVLELGINKQKADTQAANEASLEVNRRGTLAEQIRANDSLIANRASQSDKTRTELDRVQQAHDALRDYSLNPTPENQANALAAHAYLTGGAAAIPNFLKATMGEKYPGVLTLPEADGLAARSLPTNLRQARVMPAPVITSPGQVATGREAFLPPPDPGVGTPSSINPLFDSGFPTAPSVGGAPAAAGTTPDELAVLGQALKEKAPQPPVPTSPTTPAMGKTTNGAATLTMPAKPVVATRASNKQREDLMAGEQTLNSLAHALVSMNDPNAKDAFSASKGIAGWFGDVGQSLMNSRLTPEQAEARSRVFDRVVGLMKKNFGTAISQREGSLGKQVFPTATDNDSTVRSKLTNLAKIAQEEMDTRRSMVEPELMGQIQSNMAQARTSRQIAPEIQTSLFQGNKEITPNVLKRTYGNIPAAQTPSTSFKSDNEVIEAYKQKRLSPEQAHSILRTQFGYTD